MNLNMISSFEKLNKDILNESRVIKSKRDRDGALILPVSEKSSDDEYWTKKYFEEHPNAKI